jgi:hypothetical protein
MKQLAACVALSVVLSASAHAQERARRVVAAGEVTGLELAIEGALHAPAGGHVRWLVTTYEVLRRRDLRVASGLRVSVSASFENGETLATATSDSTGHAVLDIALPEDLAFSPTVSVEVVSARGVRRTFDAPITLDTRTQVELVVDRDVVPRGGSVALIGRVRSAIDGGARRSEDVTIQVHAAPPVAPMHLTTDAAGAFIAEIALPDHEGPYVIEASCDDATALVHVRVSDDVASGLWVRAVASPSIVRPGDEPTVDVLVRDESGTAVEGARVDWTYEPARGDDEIVRTDANGHARLAWRIDRLEAPSVPVDLTRPLSVVHSSHGTAEATATVRVARSDVFVTWSVEGGALTRDLSAQLFARATHADGSPAAGVSITLGGDVTAPIHAATTDADGVCAFDITATGTTSDADGCGGPTAVLATLAVDGAPPSDACVPIEPDALLTVHAEHLTDRIAIRVARRPEASSRSVAVMGLVRHGEAWEPFARQLLAPHEDTALIDPPPSAAVVWIRARPIVDGEEVVGGGTVLFAGGAPAIDALVANESGASFDAPTAASRSIVAVDASAAAALTTRIAEMVSLLGAAFATGRAAIVDGLAASLVPRDTTAPAALREGAIVPLAMPDDAPARGLLRDPWRTRARFVRGRLGALMRAVEQAVDSRVPDRIDEVGREVNGAWRFDREMLRTAMEETGLGDERATALDGEPLDIDALTTLDPNFTFDHVARRITRARLFRMLWLLRRLVRERELDLAWARPGDPREYPLNLLTTTSDGEYARTDDLYDGWGHPFALVPVHGVARAPRFQPVPGFELASGGPDGRIGNADDVFDPFARVLASGSVYAEAVSEDELVARLSSVELARATVATLAETFAVVTVVADEVPDVGARASWGSEPTMLHDASRDPLAPVPALSHALVASSSAPSLHTDWTPASAVHDYVAFALAMDDRGGLALRTAPFTAGAPFVVHVTLPTVLRVGDVARVPIRVVALGSDAALPASSVDTAGTSLRAHVENGELVLEALAPGQDTVTLTTTSGASVTTESHVRVLPLGSLRAANAGTVAAGDVTIDAAWPEGQRWRARYVIGSPSMLRHDPIFAEAHDAALSAWADVMAGVTPTEADLAALESVGGGLGGACALVALAATVDARDPRLARALTMLGGIPSELPARAAMLAALAPAAPAIGDSSSPVACATMELRDDAWRTLATERDHPTTMAEMAAALLLVDREDTVARALFDRARATIDEHAGFTAGADALPGTLALAIAARQLGEDALADELAASAVRRLHLARRADRETRFWALAASAFGALGATPARDATLTIDGATRAVTLDDVLVLDDVPTGARMSVRADAAVFVRSELRALVPYASSGEQPIEVRVEGDVGARGERAGLVLVVEATGDTAFEEPVVELALPALGALDATARAAVTSSSAVRTASELDGAGVLRLELRPLRAHGTLRVPLPLSWIASGSAHGLGAVVYERSVPWQTSSSAERVVEVGVR